MDEFHVKPGDYKMRLNVTIVTETASSGPWGPGLRHKSEVTRDRTKTWSSSLHFKNQLW